MSAFTRSERNVERPVPDDPTKNESSTSATGKSAPSPPSLAETSTSLISAALKLKGRVESTEDIRIDGHIEGDVHARNVTIGSGARIEGTINAENVEVAGTVVGNIEAKVIIVKKAANMTGDLIHDELQIDRGAHVEGHCRPRAKGSQLGKIGLVSEGTAPKEEVKSTKSP